MAIDQSKIKELGAPNYIYELADEKEFTDAVYALFAEFLDKHKQPFEKYKINELFYTGDHWKAAEQAGIFSDASANSIQPTTPVLFSTIDNIESDLRLSYPEAIFLPQTLADARIAKELTQIVSQILEDCDYELAYEKQLHDALVCGIGVVQTLYDEYADDAKGAIQTRYIDCKNFMADPNYENIQDGRACFKFTRVRADYIYEHYPDKFELVEFDAQRLLGERDSNSPIAQDEAPRETVLLEYWYKEYDEKQTKATVHMALFAGNVLLDDSKTNFKDGYFAHGQYPFSALTLYQIKGTYLGFTLIEVFKTMQIYSDKLDQIVLINAALVGNPRKLVSDLAQVDMEALNDPFKKVIMGQNISEMHIRYESVPIVPMNIASLAQTMRETIKEESGQNQFGRGEGGKGVTAASAIQALQEAAGKRSSKLEKHIHAVFKTSIVNQILELIRQFYTDERIFIITDTNAQTGADQQYEVAIQNGKIGREDAQGGIIESEIPARLRVQTKVQRQKVYDTQYQNDFALQILQYAQGTELLDVLPIMNFSDKEQVKQLLSARKAFNDQLMQAQQQAEQSAQELEQERQFEQEASSYYAKLEQSAANLPPAQPQSSTNNTAESPHPPMQFAQGLAQDAQAMAPVAAQ